MIFSADIPLSIIVNFYFIQQVNIIKVTQLLPSDKLKKHWKGQIKIFETKNDSFLIYFNNYVLFGCWPWKVKNNITSIISPIKRMQSPFTIKTKYKRISRIWEDEQAVGLSNGMISGNFLYCIASFLHYLLTHTWA